MTDSNDKNTTDEILARSDSYSNLVTGLGTAFDKSTGTVFLSDYVLSPTELAVIYEQDAVAARVVDRLVDDATRTGFTLKGADETFDFASILSELEDLDAVNQAANGWRWARLFGGGLVIMAVNDGRPFHEPLDLSAATKLSALSVVDSSTAVPGIYAPGLGSRAFALPEHYEIVLPFGSGKQTKIHRSRVIRFDGLRVPPSRMINNGGWAPSVLQRTWRDLKRLGSAMASAENLLHELSVMVFGLEGFREMLCGAPGQRDTIKQMLETLKWGVDNLHFLALDKRDDFTEIKRSVDGVAALIDKFVDALVRATNMPRLIILGEQPGGLGNSDQGEVKAWYDSVAAEQKLILTPALNRLLEVIFAIRRNKGEVVPEEWHVEYDSLVQESPEKEAQTNFLNAQTAQILVINGLASPDELRGAMVKQGLIVPLPTADIGVGDAGSLLALGARDGDDEGT